MKKVLSLVLAVAFLLSSAPVSFAAAATLGAPTEWASAGTQAQLANDGTDAAASDTVALAGFALTITNDGVNSDTATVFNTFTLGAITNAGAAAAVTTTAPAAAAGNLAVTIASVVTNGGAMTVQNTNASAVNTSQTVSGTTTLGAGALAVTNAEATNNQSVALTLTGGLVSSASVAVTGAAGASGTGSAATLTLNGAANSITGNAVLNDSTANSRGIASLVVNGAALTVGNINGAVAGEGTLTLGNGTVVTGNVGATRIGTLNITNGDAEITGTVGATVINLGANTLTEGGALTLPASATINLTANSGTDFGNAAITGAITNNAATTFAVTVNGYVPNGATLNVLNASAGAPTAVTTTPTSTSPNVSFAVSVANTNDLVLTATRTAAAATAGNNTNVATAINGAGTPTGDFATVLGQLDSLTTSTSVDAAYTQLDPISNAGANAASFTAVNESLGALSAHLGEVNSDGQSGVSTGDFWKDNGFWVKGFGSGAEQDARGTANGYDATLWGAIGGVDGIVQDNTRLGFAAGYANTSVDNKVDLGGTDIDSIQGTVYLSYDDPSPWYANGGFSFNWNMYDGSRNIAFGTINRTASADYDGQQYTGFFDLGYVWKTTEWEKGQEWAVTPLGGLTYSHLDIEDYTETGADSLNLAVASQEYDLLQSTLGIKVERPWTDASGKFVPEVHFKWLYDFIGDEAATTSTFTGGGSSFSTTGADPAQHSFNVGAGLTFFSKGNVSISGTYDFQIKDDYTSHTGQGVLRWTY